MFNSKPESPAAPIPSELAARIERFKKEYQPALEALIPIVNGFGIKANSHQPDILGERLSTAIRKMIDDINHPSVKAEFPSTLSTLFPDGYNQHSAQAILRDRAKDALTEGRRQKAAEGCVLIEAMEEAGAEKFIGTLLTDLREHFVPPPQPDQAEIGRKQKIEQTEAGFRERIAAAKEKLAKRGILPPGH